MEVPFERPDSKQISKCFLYNENRATSVFTAITLVQSTTRIVLLSSMLPGMALKI